MRGILDAGRGTAKRARASRSGGRPSRRSAGEIRRGAGEGDASRVRRAQQALYILHPGIRQAQHDSGLRRADAAKGEASRSCFAVGTAAGS